MSILDIENGKQPMATRDNNYVIIFNGEIYNHKNLRIELKNLGYNFLTKYSDTEVVLLGYRHFGEKILTKLNGMFSFVIYDKVKHCLFIGRDRFGEKPFYYSHTNNCFAFASELNALCQHQHVSKRQNERSLIKFLGYGYIPSPLTIIKNCFKLSPGHGGYFNISDMSLNIFEYWRFKIEPDDLNFTKNNLQKKLKNSNI